MRQEGTGRIHLKKSFSIRDSGFTTLYHFTFGKQPPISSIGDHYVVKTSISIPNLLLDRAYALFYSLFGKTIRGRRSALFVLLIYYVVSFILQL